MATVERVCFGDPGRSETGRDDAVVNTATNALMWNLMVDIHKLFSSDFAPIGRALGQLDHGRCCSPSLTSRLSTCGSTRALGKLLRPILSLRAFRCSQIIKLLSHSMLASPALTVPV